MMRSARTLPQCWRVATRGPPSPTRTCPGPGSARRRRPWRSALAVTTVAGENDRRWAESEPAQVEQAQTVAERAAAVVPSAAQPVAEDQTQQDLAVVESEPAQDEQARPVAEEQQPVAEDQTEQELAAVETEPAQAEQAQTAAEEQQPVSEDPTQQDQAVVETELALKLSKRRPWPKSNSRWPTIRPSKTSRWRRTRPSRTRGTPPAIALTISRNSLGMADGRRQP